MELNSEQFEKIRKYEQRKGISYIKTTDKKYKGIVISTFIFWLYSSVMSILYILGRFVRMSSDEGYEWDNLFLTIIFAFCVSLISIIFYCLKLKIIGISACLVSNIVLFISFAKLLTVDATTSSREVLEYDPGIFGLKKAFYIRHGVPIIVLSALLILMAFFIIRERKILRNEILKISENEYKSEILPDGE